MAEPLPKILREPGALALKNMRRIERENVVNAILPSHGLNAFDLMLATGLGLYQHATKGYMLIGLNDPFVHEHERWGFYRQSGGSTWLTIVGDARRVFAGSGDIPTVIGSADFLVQQTVKKLDVRYSSAWHANRLQAGMFDGLVQAVDASYKLPLTVEDRHDLLFHYDAWQARTPGYEGMPRELVRRMHGLGPMLEWEHVLYEPLDTPGNIWEGTYG